jgi:hypothetical protein
LEAAGADHTYLTMSEAGLGLAEHIIRKHESPKPERD